MWTRIDKRLQPHLAYMLTSTRLRGWRRRFHDSDQLQFFHRPGDPYSHLLLDVLPELLRRYALTLRPRVIAMPSLEAVPHPVRAEAYQFADAQPLARAWGIDFAPAAPPAESHRVLARRILLHNEDSDDFLVLAQDVGNALWDGDVDQLAVLAARHGALSEGQAETQLEENQATLEALGHYLGGTLLCAGEWYWGLDRVSLLEQHLEERGRGPGDDARVSRRLDPARAFAPTDAEPCARIDLYFSFRSPYSYLVLSRLFAICAKHGVPVIVKPLLPMVRRGVPLLRAKRRYILADAARVATQLKIPFGRICDPLGKGVENCLAVFELARELGCEKEFVHAATQAAFAEGADLGHLPTLHQLTAGVGLPDTRVADALTDRRWHKRVEGDRAELEALGHWGVPTICARARDGRPLWSVWGQDRLWMLDAWLAARNS